MKQNAFHKKERFFIVKYCVLPYAVHQLFQHLVEQYHQQTRHNGYYCKNQEKSGQAILCRNIFNLTAQNRRQFITDCNRQIPHSEHKGSGGGNKKR